MFIKLKYMYIFSQTNRLLTRACENILRLSPRTSSRSGVQLLLHVINPFHGSSPTLPAIRSPIPRVQPNHWLARLKSSTPLEIQSAHCHSSAPRPRGRRARACLERAGLQLPVHERQVCKPPRRLCATNSTNHGGRS